MEVQGQDQVTGLPRPVTLTTGEIVEALQEPLKQIVELGARFLKKPRRNWFQILLIAALPCAAGERSCAASINCLPNRSAFPRTSSIIR